MLYDSTPVLIDSYDKDFKYLLEDCTHNEREILIRSRNLGLNNPYASLLK